MTTTTASVFFLIFLFWPILQLQLLGIRKQPQEENFLVQHMGDSGPHLSWLPNAGCESGTLATACRMAVCPRDDVVIHDSWPKIFFLALSCYVRILDSRFAIHDSRLDPCVSYRKKCMFCLLSTHSATNFRMVGIRRRLLCGDDTRYDSRFSLVTNSARPIKDTMTVSLTSKRATLMSITSLAAPLGALSIILTPWGQTTAKSLLVEPIRINPPVWLRLLLGLIVITNIRSTPFAWHIRVLYPAIKAVVRSRSYWSSRSSSALTHASITPQLKLSCLPLGRDIFSDTSSYTFTATLDECDWNGHLSNSSYSKSLDFTRMAHNSARFLKMYYDGGWVALGGSAFNFHREIPLLAKYKVRMSFESWDDKWLYVVGRFVSVNRSSSSPKETSSATEKLEQGETLYCTSISRYVCKAGRRTIPPWLVIATSGYGTRPETRSNWEKAELLRVSYLEKERQAYRAKTGKHTISKKADAKLVKKAALLRQFRTESERKGTQDEAWMSKSYWGLDEWETRRKEGFERLSVSVGTLPAVEKS